MIKSCFNLINKSNIIGNSKLILNSTNTVRYGKYLLNNRYYSSSNNNNNNGKNNNGNKSRSYGKYFLGGIGLTAGILCGPTLFLDDKTREPSLKESIVTNYQNRIREFSTPEKIFQTFASIEKNGEKYMTLDDFIRAILPHKSATTKKSKSNAKTNENLPLSFKIADVDGDGLISYGEFLFFSTLLSIPQNSAAIAFKIMDINQDNSIDSSEFMNIIKILQNQSQFAKNTSATNPKTEVVAQGWIDHLFGKNGDKKLSLQQFQNLLDQVRRDVQLLEFNFYDKERTGRISQRDFGLLLVSYSKSGKLDEHMKAVNSLPSQINDKEKGVSFEQYVQFNKLLDKLPDVALSMDLYKDMNQAFTKTQFKYICNIICQFNPEPVVLDVVYKVFDSDNNGNLEKDEFVNILSRRKYRGLQNQRNTGFMEKLKKIKNIIFNQE